MVQVPGTRQGRRKVFYGGGGGGRLSKNVGHQDWSTAENEKKRPKGIPQKQNLDQNINDSKSHFKILFLKMLFWAYNFFMFVHRC